MDPLPVTLGAREGPLLHTHTEGAQTWSRDRVECRNKGGKGTARAGLNASGGGGYGGQHGKEWNQPGRVVPRTTAARPNVTNGGRMTVYSGRPRGRIKASAPRRIRGKIRHAWVQGGEGDLTGAGREGGGRPRRLGGGSRWRMSAL